MQAVCCLNHLVSNAMTHATASLEYMARLRDQQVFRFCAIPQVMAIATLAACYDNANVFKKVVKIPRSSRRAARPAHYRLASHMLLTHQRAHHGHHAQLCGRARLFPALHPAAKGEGESVKHCELALRSTPRRFAKKIQTPSP